MLLASTEVDSIFKAVDDAELRALAISVDARMDDVYYLESIFADLHQIKEVLLQNLSLERRRKKMENKKDFRKMYDEFERKYNKYPVQMSRAEAFGHALKEGLIDEQTYKEAHEYYGNLWNYVGD